VPGQIGENSEWVAIIPEEPFLTVDCRTERPRESCHYGAARTVSSTVMTGVQSSELLCHLFLRAGTLELVALIPLNGMRSVDDLPAEVNAKSRQLRISVEVPSRIEIV
jgi:hypothetical protein